MAQLKTGTTIGGNVSWHAGNDGPGSTLDADTVDGLHAADLATKGRVVRSIPTVVGDYIEIGNLTAASGSHSGVILVEVSDTGFALSQVIPFAANWNETATGWVILGSISDPGAYNSNNIQVEMNVNSNTASFRLVRIQGTTAGTATIDVIYNNDSTFTATSATGTGQSSTWYDHAKLRQSTDLFFGNDKVWHAGNDGTGSGLDADTVDGQHASAFATSGHNHDATYVNVTGDTMTGNLIVAKNAAQIKIEQDPGTAGGSLLWMTAAGTGSDSNAATIQLHSGGAIWGRTDGANSGIRFGAYDKTALWASLTGTTLAVTGTITSGGTAVSLVGHTHTAANITDFAEAVSDQVGTMVTGNTETGITVTYDDADNTLDFAVAYGTTPPALTPDIAGAAGVANTASRSDHVHNVPAATAVGLSNSSTSAEGTSGSFARADHTHAITGFALTSHTHTAANVTDLTEAVQDIVGGMVTGNTETNITVTYDDTDGTLDFVVAGGVTDHGALTGLGDDDHTQYLLKTGGTMTGNIHSTGASTGAAVFTTNVSGNAFNRFMIHADGSIAIGGGTAATDIYIFRSGVGELSFDTGDKLILGADPTVALGAATKQYVDNNFAAISHNHSAANITSGTLAVARGGTGIASYTTGNYINASGATTLQQRTPAQVLSDIGAAAASHAHSAADITSGTLAVARGGTGIASYTTGNYINASGATTLQQRTPAQVLSDIGAAASGHNHDSSYVNTTGGDEMAGTLLITGGTPLRLGTSGTFTGLNLGTTGFSYYNAGVAITSSLLQYSSADLRWNIGFAGSGGLNIEGPVLRKAEPAYLLKETVYYTTPGSGEGGPGFFVKADYPGLRAVRVMCVGAGGGGGGTAACTATQVASAGGGGAGAYAESWLLESELDASETVTVGAGGGGGAAGANTGSSGGGSAFGGSDATALVYAAPGTGGPGATANSGGGATSGGNGGTAASSVGDLIVPGANGGIGVEGATANVAMSGTGGDSVLGMGAVSSSSSNGNAAAQYGAGGGGGSGRNSSAARSGGAGSNGIVIVEVYV